MLAFQLLNFLTSRLLDFSISSRVDLVNRTCQLKVLLRDSAFAVRGEADAYLAVIDGNVRMVVGPLSSFGDFVHKGDGGHKRLESELLLDRIAGVGPPRHAHQRPADFILGQGCHANSFLDLV